MAIFSQYAAVLEADGTPMSVRTALQLINRFLAEDDFDHDTQFCLHWFEGRAGPEASTAKPTCWPAPRAPASVACKMLAWSRAAGQACAAAPWAELPRDWSPETDVRLSVWEALHHLIRALNQDGESAAGALLARMPAKPSRCAHWPTGSTHCASARAGPRKRAPTTSWSLRGLEHRTSIG
jgi:putative DNA methylase